MPTPYLVASLSKLRDEFNNLAPKRDKASDGWIGDAAHSSRASDHNPDEKGAVHAIDVDRDLRLAGLSMEDVVQFLLVRCRSGQETRLKYVIFNRRIWTKSNNWRQQDYLGQNPHDHHAHFSGVYEAAAERSVKSWQLADLLQEEDVTIDYEKIRKIVQEEAERALLAYARGDGDTTGRTYSRDGLVTTTEQDTKLIRAKLDEIEKRLPAPPA